MNRTRSVLRGAGHVAVWGFGVVCVGVLLAVGVGPHTGRYRTLTVLTGSMQPGIPVGSVIVVTPERPNQLRVGQVVTYRIPVEDHRVISHRVVRVFEGGEQPVFQTQGDANNAPDYWLAQVNGDTVWRVSEVVPRVGLVLHWLRQPTVHLLAAVIVPAALAFLLVIDIWKDEPEESLVVFAG
jgi:signal peptidase